MRCKNCGWPNKPAERFCVKCNTPLDSDNDDAFGASGNNRNADAQLNRTVREDVAFGLRSAQQQETTSETTILEDESAPCPKCGYPVRQGADKCPNCKFDLNRQQSDAVRSVPKDRPKADETIRINPTRMTNGNDKGGLHRGTVNPWMMNVEAEPSFVLKPLKRANERHELDEMEYEGREVVLNRENTEENNPSITSHEQAVISRESDGWFIEDRSEQKTTFVQAASKIALHDGDIILLGNRLFEFRE